MEPESSLPCSQEPATGPSSETDAFIPHLTNQPTNQPTNQLTNCMEHSPSWEADSHSGSQEFSRLLRFITVFTRACRWFLS